MSFKSFPKGCIPENLFQLFRDSPPYMTVTLNLSDIPKIAPAVRVDLWMNLIIGDMLMIRKH
jgi:hypothetical protein